MTLFEMRTMIESSMHWYDPLIIGAAGFCVLALFYEVRR